MKKAPKAWKEKVKKNLKKAGFSDKSADAAIKAVWKKGMKNKCRSKVIKKYKR